MAIHQADLVASRRDQARIDANAMEIYLGGDVDLADGLSIDAEIVGGLRRQAIAMDGAGKWQRSVDLVLGLSALGSIHPVDAVLLARALFTLGDPDGSRLCLSLGDRLCRAMDMAPLGRDESNALLGVIVDQIEAVSLSEARDAWEEARRLSSSVESLRAFCARKQRGSDAEAVSAALRAAGASPAASKFPTAQLSLIASRSTAQSRDDRSIRIEEFSEQRRPLRRSAAERERSEEVSSLEDAARVVSHLLGEDLEGGLTRAGRRATDREAFAQNLGTFAMLIDQAASAPSYAIARIGEHHPIDRAGYRAKRHAGIVGLLSESRAEETQCEGVRIAKATIEAKVPNATLESMLVARFIREIGLHEKHAGPIRSTAAGVRKAIAEELLFPLRALNETVHDMSDLHGHFVELRDAVNAVIRHVLEDDLETWRYRSQPDRWRSARSGPMTREIGGIELFWSGKIGRPTFAFDRAPQALLGLVANGRSKMIISDGARARIMLLTTARADGGEPRLLLGPVSGRANDETRRAFVRHAIDKADHLGVRLAIPVELEAHAERSGVRSSEPYVFEESAGVIEVSPDETREWVSDARCVATVGEMVVLGGGS